MNQEYDIVRRVYAAKEDTLAADDLVRQYLPFIKAETAKFIKRPPREGEDDELSIAMFAFHEAVMQYRKGKGAFLSYAAQGIRHRLIDHYRKEKRHGQVVSLQEPISDGKSEMTRMEQLDSGHDHVGAHAERSATREEIMEYAAQLASMGLTLGDVAENCPRQERTRKACYQALYAARQDQDILKQLVDTGKLPLARLCEASGTDRKTLERHRKYMVALLVAYTNGYEIIRGHLCQMAPQKGGQKA